MVIGTVLSKSLNRLLHALQPYRLISFLILLRIFMITEDGSIFFGSAWNQEFIDEVRTICFYIRYFDSAASMKFEDPIFQCHISFRST